MNKVRTLANEQGSLIFIELNRQLFINRTQRTASLFAAFLRETIGKAFMQVQREQKPLAELITLIEHK